MSAHPETAELTASARASAERDIRHEEPRGAYCPSLLRLVFDAMVLLAALGVGEFFFPGPTGRTSTTWLIAFPLLVLALLDARGAYRHRIHLHVLDDVRMVVTTTAFAGMVTLSLRVLVTDDAGAAGQTVRYWAYATAGLVTMHSLMRLLEIRARRRGEVGELTLLIGAGKVGRLVAERLGRYPELGFRPVGFLDDAPLAENGQPLPVPVLGGTGNLEDVVHAHGVRHVVVTFSMASHEVLLDLIQQCREQGVKVSFVPRLFESMKDKVTIESIGSIPLVSVEHTNPKGSHFSVKYALDRVVAGALLLLLLPVLLATALVVAVGSGRPIIYRQRRIGRDGRCFEMLKFRSMEPRGETGTDALELPPDIAPGGEEGAERTTRIGRFLRQTSLDELPQLVNVLRGEMSLVGPRPERPEYVEIFKQDVHRYADRHRVKAGITGWAQINGLRGNSSLSDRAEWDNYYIDNWSLWLDLKILLSTATVLVRSRGR